MSGILELTRKPINMGTKEITYNSHIPIEIRKTNKLNQKTLMNLE
jgi:hypothetical protein